MNEHLMREILRGVEQALHSQGVINANVSLSNYLALLGRIMEGCILIALVYQHFGILECKRKLVALLGKLA